MTTGQIYWNRLKERSRQQEKFVNTLLARKGVSTHNCTLCWRSQDVEKHDHLCQSAVTWRWWYYNNPCMKTNDNENLKILPQKMQVELSLTLSGNVSLPSDVGGPLRSAAFLWPACTTLPWWCTCLGSTAQAQQQQRWKQQHGYPRITQHCLSTRQHCLECL